MKVRGHKGFARLPVTLAPSTPHPEVRGQPGPSPASGGAGPTQTSSRGEGVLSRRNPPCASGVAGGQGGELRVRNAFRQKALSPTRTLGVKCVRVLGWRERGRGSIDRRLMVFPCVLSTTVPMSPINRPGDRLPRTHVSHHSNGFPAERHFSRTKRRVVAKLPAWRV